MKLKLGVLALGLCVAQVAASSNATPQKKNPQGVKSQGQNANNGSLVRASPQDVRTTLDTLTAFALAVSQFQQSVNISRAQGHKSGSAKGQKKGKSDSCVIGGSKSPSKSRKTGKERRDLEKRGRYFRAGDAVQYQCPYYTFGSRQYVPAFTDAINAIVKDRPFKSRASSSLGTSLTFPLPLENTGSKPRSHRYEKNPDVPPGCRGINGDNYAFLYQFPIIRTKTGEIKRWKDGKKPTNDVVIVATNQYIRWGKRTYKNAQYDYEDRKIDIEPYAVACGVLTREPRDDKETYDRPWQDCEPITEGHYDFPPSGPHEQGDVVPYDPEPEPLPEEDYYPDPRYQNRGFRESDYPPEYYDELEPDDDGDDYDDYDDDYYDDRSPSPEYEDYYEDTGYMPEHCSYGSPNNYVPRGNPYPPGPPSQPVYPPPPPRGAPPPRGGPPRGDPPPGMSKAAMRYTPGNVQAY